jgi:hypothetical protein
MFINTELGAEATSGAGTTNSALIKFSLFLPMSDDYPRIQKT